MTASGISLRVKVALSASLLLLAVAGAVAGVLFRYQWLFLTREGEKRVRSLAENLAINARDPLLVGDELGLGPITRSVLRDPDVRWAYVADHEGTILFHPDTLEIGRKHASPMPERVEKTLVAEQRIVVEGTHVGTAVVALGTGFVDAAMRATALGLLALLGGCTVLGVGGIFLLTGLHVRRIEKLEGAVQALGAGDLLVKAEVDGSDEVARLARHFNHMVEQLQGAQEEIERGVTETVSALAATIEAKDAYTGGHCLRVAQTTRAIAERLGVDGKELKEFELAAILHDIGKIGVSAKVLRKQGRLDEAETAEMRQHAELGARILAPLSFLGDVPTYIQHHHEDWDGSGYPAGMAGDEAPLASRIIHLADAYDAMTSSRPYRSALRHAEAVRRIVEAKGGQFDPSLVEVFLALEREGRLPAVAEGERSRAIA